MGLGHCSVQPHFIPPKGVMTGAAMEARGARDNFGEALLESGLRRRFRV